MKALFTEEEFECAKASEKLPCECYQCAKIFYSKKSNISAARKGHVAIKVKFCSIGCGKRYNNLNNKIDCPSCNQKITTCNINVHLKTCGTIRVGTRRSQPKYEHGNSGKGNQYTKAKATGIPYVISEKTKEKLKIAGAKRKHTEENKQKIREQKIKLYQEHPEKIPFKMYKYFEKSYPEKTFEHGLTSNTITNYIYDYKQGMYYYDFAIPKFKLDFEIDGDFHNKPERIIRDNLRDEYSLRNGWTIIRFEARLVLKQLDYCIEKVKDVLKNFDDYKGRKIKYWYKDYINKKATPNK